ncbi:MAG TPA: pilin [Candidatus Paceibacterota bacterium]|jgi:hypothetical protein
MRALLIALLLVLSAAPVVTQAAAFDFIQIVPDVCDCDKVEALNGDTVRSAPAFGCVLQVIQNIIQVAIMIGFVMATLALMYTGFVWMTSGANAEKRRQGKNLFLNVLLGLALILGAWLIVDFVMKTLTDQDGGLGPWNKILVGTGDSANGCLLVRESGTLASGKAVLVSDPLKTAQQAGNFTGGAYTYQEGIEAQKPHASANLTTVLNCMSTQLPKGVGEISSISDERIISGQKTFNQCAIEGNKNGGTCAHSKNSCHYGGATCRGNSYAVDFGDQQNAAALTAAARACGASDVYNEGNHIHVSVGRASGCGCDN